MKSSTRKHNVELRGGRVVEVEITPPTPPKTKEDVGDNSLEYVQSSPLAFDNVKCEKFLVHRFDGTPATRVVKVKFLLSPDPSVHALCETCADAMLCAMLGDVPPSSNTGVTNYFTREENQE